MATVDYDSVSKQPVVRREAGPPMLPDQDPPNWEQPGSVVDKVARMIFAPAPWWWWVGLLISVSLLAVFIFTLGSITFRGTGLWNINIPTVWAMDILNLVFWIGIGHAGTVHFGLPLADAAELAHGL
ncbi:MAG: hypothetical protein HC915_10245 [Anaerolineae bacterium]|nr:hypothetical protein [Anaerolineae bacterium]